MDLIRVNVEARISGNPTQCNEFNASRDAEVMCIFLDPDPDEMFCVLFNKRLEVSDEEIFEKCDKCLDATEGNDKLYKAFDIKTVNLFQRENIETITELRQKTDAELLSIKGLGRKSLKKIREYLDN